MKKKNIVVTLLLVLGLLSITLGVSVAFFNYTRTGGENILAVGRIYFNSTQGTSINLTNVFPVKSTELENNPNVDSVTLTITGDTTYNDGLEYLVSSDQVVNTVGGKKVPIGIRVTVNNLGTIDDSYFENRGGNSSIYKVLSHDTIDEDEELVVGYITKGATGINGTVTIQAFIDADRIAVSDTYDRTESDMNGTTNDWVNGRTVLTTNEWNSLSSSGVSFELKVEANEGVWVNESYSAAEIVRQGITAKINAETNSCNPIYEEDNITYFSGTNDCVDMNYVWYSGKLWRITAIYPDGTMKLVTANSITNIEFGHTANFVDSWAYQWLNVDFYDTLYNPSDIIVNNANWNYSYDESNPPQKPELIVEQKILAAPIGLLTAYDYYNAYRNASTSTNYLNINSIWRLLTPKSENAIRHISATGAYSTIFNVNPSFDAYGVRPSIVLKSDINFAGNGSIDNPYTIVGDKAQGTTGDLLTTRSVGEYVKFDNDIYRIMEINKSSGTVKIINSHHLEESGTSLTKYFASTVLFGNSNNTQSNDYWDYYLNNAWYNSISSTYKNMLVDDTYYLGQYPHDRNYKITVCNDENLERVAIKNCTRYANNSDRVFIGKVGLARSGEMFASQFRIGNESAVSLWIITPYSDTYSRIIGSNGNSDAETTTNRQNAVRPTITLKSGIKITSGTGYVGGNTSSPFEISE